MKSVGINDIFGTNKAIIRERENCFYGSVIFPNYKGREFADFLVGYEAKKRLFQKQLEEKTGDNTRLIRILEMATTTIVKWGLNIKRRGEFKTFINTDYKLSIHDVQEVANFMNILLDTRNDMFKEYKDKIKDFMIKIPDVPEKKSKINALKKETDEEIENKE
jgi:hypothetical protein